MRKNCLSSRINRVVCVTASLALSLCMLPATAFATVGEASNGTTYVSSDGVTVVEDVDYQEIDLVSLTTAEDYALDENGAPSLKPGNHVRWIDRIKIPSQYVTLYNTLVSESRDASGCLVNPAADESIEVASGSLGSGPLTFTTSAATESERKSEVDNYLKGLIDKAVKEACSYTYAAANAFDADHPEVFWMTGVTSTPYRVWYGWSGSCTQNGNSYTYSITPNAGWTLSYSVRRSDGFDVRKAEYQDVSVLTASMSERDANVSAIVSEVTANNTITSRYKVLKKLNKWLTANNDYNSCVAQGNSSSASKDAWECVSALSGSSGAKGPVCEGYARAFKVVCDELDIPCVLTEGLARTSSSDTVGSGHMWNYVQVGEKWYGEDATWNDPLGYEDTSGNENYFLVGADTVIHGMRFIDSHPVSNRRSSSSSAPSFTNGPVLESSAYSANFSWVGETIRKHNINEHYIVANADGSCPEVELTSSLSVDGEAPNISDLTLSNASGTSVSLGDLHSGSCYTVSLNGFDGDSIAFTLVKPNDIWLWEYSWVTKDAYIDYDGTVKAPEIFYSCDADFAVSGEDFELEYRDLDSGLAVELSSLQGEKTYAAVPVFPEYSTYVNELGEETPFTVIGKTNLANQRIFSTMSDSRPFIDENGLLNLGGLQPVMWNYNTDAGEPLAPGTYEISVYSSDADIEDGEPPLDLSQPVYARDLQYAVIVIKATDGGPYVGEMYCDIMLEDKYELGSDSFCIEDGKIKLSVLNIGEDERRRTPVDPENYEVHLYEADDEGVIVEVAPSSVVLGRSYSVEIEGISGAYEHDLFFRQESMAAVAPNDISMFDSTCVDGSVIDPVTGAYTGPVFEIFDFGKYETTKRAPGVGYEIIATYKLDEDTWEYEEVDTSVPNAVANGDTLRFTLKGIGEFTGTTYAYYGAWLPTGVEFHLGSEALGDAKTISIPLKISLAEGFEGITSFAFTVSYDTSCYKLKTASCDAGSVFAGGTLIFDPDTDLLSWQSSTSVAPAEEDTIYLNFEVICDDPVCSEVSLEGGEDCVTNGTTTLSFDQYVGAIAANHLWDYSGLCDIPDVAGELGSAYYSCGLCGSGCERDFVFGDVNADGFFDVRDLVLVQRALAGTNELSSYQRDVANVVSSDVELNMKDLVFMAKQLLE